MNIIPDEGIKVFLAQYGQQPKPVINIRNMQCFKPKLNWDVCVDRSSPLGNPFKMTRESERDAVCEKYIIWFKDRLHGYPHLRFWQELMKLQDIIEEHRVLNLYCWCAPKRCHAETIRAFLLRELK